MRVDFAQEPDVDLSPAGALSLLWPAIPDSLVGSVARARIEAAAASLAPIARIALELRLGHGEDEVDLHQFITTSDADVAVLRRYLAQRGPSAREDDALWRFLRAWGDDIGSLRGDLDGFFLEWDGPDAASPRPPAIFLPVQDRHDHESEARARRSLVAGHVARLGLAEGYAAILRSIPEACSISYTGFMLGRGSGVRINLRAVQPDALDSLLIQLDWSGDRSRAVDLFAMLVHHTGRVAVALDFAPAIQPSIGFEAALPDFPDREPRWRLLLDRLCSDGLCTPEKRDVLQRVGVRLYPERAGQDWPASWIAATLRAATKHVPWFERRLSHVKISIGQDGQVGAKAYLSGQHHWIRNAPPSRSRLLNKAASGSSPIARAAAFLLAEREQDGFWRDFRLVNGASDEWVTAFVGYALIASGVPVPGDLVATTVETLLRRQRVDGGWGYNAISPADADSTAWVLKFFRAADYRGPAMERGEAFLRAHILPDGGIATYAPSTRIVFGDTADQLDDTGWRSAHGCVAANVAGVIGEPVTNWLVADQAPDGAWASYWWRTDYFATALAVDALADHPSGNMARAQALAWATQREGDTASSFDRAWLLHMHAGSDALDAAERLADALAAAQRSDGSWGPGAEMLFPDPSDQRRRCDMPIVIDDRCVFTTSAAMLALSRIRQEDIVR